MQNRFGTEIGVYIYICWYGNGTYIDLKDIKNTNLKHLKARKKCQKDLQWKTIWTATT